MMAVASGAARREKIHGVRLLVFRIEGAMVGIDTDHVAGMADFGKVDPAECHLLTINELLGMGEETYKCTAPKVMMVKGAPFISAVEGGAAGTKRFGIVVERPEDIVDVPVEKIRPLPPVARAFARTAGFWGAALVPEGIIFIADVFKMFAVRKLKGESPAGGQAGLRDM